MSQLWARIDRLQKSRIFKIVASTIALVIVVALGITYLAQASSDERVADRYELFDTTTIEDPAMRAQMERQQRMVQAVLNQDQSPVAVAVGLAVLLAVMMVVIWLGLLLTYLLLGLGVMLVAYPLIVLEQLEVVGSTVGAFGRILVGAAALTVCFTAVLELLRLLLSTLSGPVFAVARNVLAEAVRMKVSLVFIVLLIFGLAAVPMLLNEGTPLRYRMQSFLQYGTSGAFWLIAILTLLLSAATMTFEQRDKIIWQTMTKPVSVWKYLLGKWLGVITLNAALLLVCGSAIFLFAEYLKQQPAQGESEAYVARGVELGGSVLSEDRRILHNQVLQAREAREIDVPMAKSSTQFAEIVDRFMEQREALDSFDEVAEIPQTRTQVRDDLYKHYVANLRSIEPGQAKTYVFSGLEQAAQQDSPLLLRYRVESGGNLPDEFYRIFFNFGGAQYEREVGLAQTLIIDDIPPEAINDNGELELTIINGRLMQNAQGDVGVAPNPRTITFPPGGLELSYSVGGFRMNFVRVVAVLWIKLAFLSLLAIAASTALSFPVACLVAFGTFFAAESAMFLQDSMEVYNPFYGEGVGPYILAVVELVAGSVIWIFKVYAELNPIEKLVQGQLVSWGSVAQGIVVLGVWCVVLFGVGWFVFRSRELAIYSGQ
ncbi:MAG: ABC transporter permease [Phycisphaerales bacterium JB064]